MVPICDLIPRRHLAPSRDAPRHHFRHASAFPRHVMPGLRKIRSLRKQRGHRECRARQAHPQPRVQNEKHTSVVTTGSPERSGIPCANGFNGFLRALPGDRAFLPPSSADDCPANLIPASRYQDHATSPSASVRFVSRTVASIASRTQRP
jgi:hypothetical protein